MRVALTLLMRDWRSGRLALLFASLVLAIASVTSISLFTSRIQNSILEEAADFLAADAQIKGSMSADEKWVSLAESSGIQMANIVSFRAMAFSGSSMQIAGIKAVSDDYPLKGHLTVAQSPFDPGVATQSGPAQGDVWITSRLFSVLNVDVGDHIDVGEHRFRVSGALIREPDNAQSIFGAAPRIMMHVDDVESTGAIQLGSRVNHTLLLSGDASLINGFKEKIDPELGIHHRWVGVGEGNRAVSASLQKAEQFLLLAGSLSVVLCGVAIALSARRYAKQQIKSIALLKTFGQTPQQITKLIVIQLAGIAVSGTIAGSVLGWLLHLIILAALGPLMPTQLAAASYDTYFIGAVSGAIALLAFAGPALMNLRSVAPALVLKENTESALFSQRWQYIIGFSAMFLLVFWYSRDILLTAYIAIGASLSLLSVAIFAGMLLRVIKRYSLSMKREWRLGWANLYRHQNANALQISVFSLLFMLIVIMFSMRTGLIKQWQMQIPEDAANHFLFNVFPEEKDQIEKILQENNIGANPFYAMTRGRVISLNDVAVQDIDVPEGERDDYERELNLTTSKTLGEDNRVLEGAWWDESNEELLASVEQEYAKNLGMKIDDTITLSIAGQEVSARVANIRSVKWDSMNPNFFVIFNRPALDGVASNWLTSFYLPPDKKLVLNTIAKNFPTVSIIELDQVILQMQDIVAKISLAIEFILVVVLCSGLLVLIAGIQSTLDDRLRESAILRSLGATRHFISTTLIIEFMALGLLAGLLGLIGAQLALYSLQTRVFDMGYSVQWYIVLSAPFIGAVLIAVIGYLSTRKVTFISPLVVLRNNN